MKYMFFLGESKWWYVFFIGNGYLRERVVDLRPKLMRRPGIESRDDLKTYFPCD